MQTLTLRVPDELKERLEKLARETAKPTAFYLRQALEEFLEDREDYLAGIAVRQQNEATVTLEELEQDLDLAR